MNIQTTIPKMLETLTFLEDQKYPTEDEFNQKFKEEQISAYLDKTKSLWQNGKVIDGGESGNMLLHWAAKKSHGIVCDLLVKKGENPFKANFGDRTAIDLAGNIPHETKQKIFNITISTFNTSTSNSNPSPSTQAACPDNNSSKLDEIKSLFEELLNIHDRDQFILKWKRIDSKSLMALKFSHGRTMLHEAAPKGNKNFIKFAQSEGLARSNKQDHDGNTFEHLLAIHADDNPPYSRFYHLGTDNKEGKTVLHLLAAHNKVNTLKNMHCFESSLGDESKEIFKGNTYYHEAAAKGSTAFLQLIWENTTLKKAREMEACQLRMGYRDYKVDYEEIGYFKALNDWGQNILHVAAEAKQTKTFEYLLSLPDLVLLSEDTDNFGKKPRDYLN